MWGIDVCANTQRSCLRVKWKYIAHLFLDGFDKSTAMNSKWTKQISDFFGNRISQIQSLSHYIQWRYVPTGLNPVDHITRDINKEQFALLKIWKCISQMYTAWTNGFFVRYSSSGRLLRITSYLIRFIYNSKHNVTKRTLEHILDETDEALKFLIEIMQIEVFSAELYALSKTKHSDSSSILNKLNPFLDHDGILRIGGTLSQSNLPYDVKHPRILPSKHEFTNILIRHEQFL